MKCNHDKKYEIIIPDDGEIVCSICGMVKDCDIHTTTSQSKTQINLYLEQVLGSKCNPKINGNRFIYDSNPDLAVISNITEKLDISHIVSRDIWKWYQKLRSHIKMTKAKILVLTFYVVCRAHGHPINEQKLYDAIRINLHVKRIHNFLKVSMEASSYLDKTGEMKTKKIGFLDMVPIINDDHNDNNVNFILSSEITSLYDVYPTHVVNEIANTTKSIIGTLEGVYSPSHAVKLAIRLAKEQCGIKDVILQPKVRSHIS